MGYRHLAAFLTLTLLSLDLASAGPDLSRRGFLQGTVTAAGAASLGKNTPEVGASNVSAVQPPFIPSPFSVSFRQKEIGTFYSAFVSPTRRHIARGIAYSEEVRSKLLLRTAVILDSWEKTAEDWGDDDPAERAKFEAIWEKAIAEKSPTDTKDSSAYRRDLEASWTIVDADGASSISYFEKELSNLEVELAREFSADLRQVEHSVELLRVDNFIRFLSGNVDYELQNFYKHQSFSEEFRKAFFTKLKVFSPRVSQMLESEWQDLIDSDPLIVADHVARHAGYGSNESILVSQNLKHDFTEIIESHPSAPSDVFLNSALQFNLGFESPSRLRDDGYISLEKHAKRYVIAMGKFESALQNLSLLPDSEVNQKVKSALSETIKALAKELKSLPQRRYAHARMELKRKKWLSDNVAASMDDDDLYSPKLTPEIEKLFKIKRPSKDMTDYLSLLGRIGLSTYNAALVFQESPLSEIEALPAVPAIAAPVQAPLPSCERVLSEEGLDPISVNAEPKDPVTR